MGFAGWCVTEDPARPSPVTRRSWGWIWSSGLSPQQRPIRSGSPTSPTSERRPDRFQAIFEWIEVWYNPKRRHSGIGDVSPLEFENTHHAARGIIQHSTRVHKTGFSSLCL